jgi:ankyrin repeat protein
MESSDRFEEAIERERLHTAADQGDLAEVQRLIAKGHPVDTFASALGWTPLHFAAVGGHLDVMKALLAAGADVDACEPRRNGNTPLRQVAGECTFAVAKALVDAGADPRIPGWMRLTALDEAARRTDFEGPAVRDCLLAAARRLDGGA